MPLIQLSHIHHTYAENARPVNALRGVSLDIEAGEFVAIVGPSGSGKSTLLNIIGTLESPSQGEYRFDGQSVAEMSGRERAQLRASRIGFVFQNFNLIDHLTVFENIRLGLRYRRDHLKNENERILSAMDKVGLAHRADHLPRELSGGQQQRCAIARAIVGDPQIVLADEPTGSLDSQNAAQVLGILAELNSRGTTLVIVTHAPRQADRAGRVVEMHDGSIHLSTRRLA
ncbi:ABC transporter ATP-binding protein [Asticcacaulis excentricus]|uniref:ABC transporter related protein n=1 Tax=Asticcacaulis excentricus (strain ATCC 15261 / DSM 4724 / KCTC 12464 / NCIMB 9791 / VKM B-1370 / CB 48) TaxID=573065 RepID=E8RTN6_ASTEC|nr:ABC transporter ATP-binding protein [Asticcacaulis excentricus]ADU14857.1 ABC transporter related protein [Asticcacaulis excentricus CB 48]